ncbi:ribose-phosphate pyrophosphokinase 1 [Lecanora helva]
MRGAKIFSGSSHPLLVDAICERLGTSPAKADLKHFSNGETCVSIETSIRDQDVFIVQSGSKEANDSVMEMLIMISACKGGSAKSITAVMPYFPYSRQSKKKSHRGAIAARLVANLLSVAGIHHVITVDLHAPPTQGFFGKPVDDLHAEPLIAKWIRNHVQGWQEGVVVSKNPGSSKRVTSLADALRLNFALVTTERRRLDTNGSLAGSGLLDQVAIGVNGLGQSVSQTNHSPPNGTAWEEARSPAHSSPQIYPQTNSAPPSAIPFRHFSQRDPGSSPLTQSTRLESASPPSSRTSAPRAAATNSPSRIRNSSEIPAEDSADEYTDERARDVVTGRLVHGHIVDDAAPSPALSTMSGSIATLSGDVLGQPQLEDVDPMTLSLVSTRSAFQGDNALGGSGDANRNDSDDEEDGFKNPEFEHTVTLIGDVKDKVVFIIDDLLDQCGSWIAAAETVVKRGEAKKVYCIATHGLFGDDSLEQMENCDCIDFIVITNTYPIASSRVRACKKLVILDISNLLAEAIRRNHYGESISALFQHYTD